MFLSLVELAPEAACSPTFWQEVATPGGAHQALWALFRRSPERRRDFLFRHDDHGTRGAGRVRFHVLSKEAPQGDGEGLWAVEVKRFAPKLKEGDRLRFNLRASPTVKKPAGEGKSGKRHDVVMNARSKHPPGETAFDLVRAVQLAGERWVVRQGVNAGFELDRGTVETIGEDGLLEEVERAALRVDGYRQHRLQRRGESPIRFSTVDCEGVLVVRDPVRFLAKVSLGFGPQKAFGCGLMLLRRG